MALKYKHQAFQTEAVNSICDVFTGQPKQGKESNYIIDKGTDTGLFDDDGFGNAELKLTAEKLSENIRDVQQRNGIKPIDDIEGDAADLMLTVEMDTGTGKTYTYIKTIFELNKRYGWRKFVIVVPSIAIREGVLNSLENMKKHFEAQYEGIINFFVYNSKQLQKIDQFSRDSNINVMVINTQAFNSAVNEEKNKDGRSGDAAARIIFTEQDSFGGRKPIDVLAANRPIIIIDEPQSVLGADKKNNTRKGIRRFNPLFTLLYSATHREIYNMVFRLDAIDAINKKLVKQIEVVGVKQVGSNSTKGYVGLEDIITSDKKYPQAKICFDKKTKSGVKQEVRLCKDGDDLYVLSGEMEEYRNNYVITIDGAAGEVKFANGLSLAVGEVAGDVNENIIRRIQIRHAIAAHLEKERKLFAKGIKVLTLFFIDHVDSYRIYKEGGVVEDGVFAKMFEEEYERVLYNEFMPHLSDKAYIDYLMSERNSAHYIHKGYFSKDGKGKSKTKEEDEQSTYDLIMKDKESLLSLDEPCRFIFSHSALKEGWDNPNVFVICTLKDTKNEIKKRQEVGRGMRLCVNTKGERQDADVLGEDHVFDYNCLTVVASESYEDFASKLQKEMAEVCYSRPMRVDQSLFVGMAYTTNEGESRTVDDDVALEIFESLVCSGYVKKGALTQKYHNDKRGGSLDLGELNYLKGPVVERLDTVFDPDKFKPENGTKKKEATFRKERFDSSAWKELWNRINHRSTYQVNFDSRLLINKAISAIDERLTVARVRIVVEQGSMTDVKDTAQLKEGRAMEITLKKTVDINDTVSKDVRYDLIGELVTKTGLTRRTIVEILKGIKYEKFGMFKENPEDFIIKAANLINEQKALSVVEKIQYNKSDMTFDTAIFSESIIRGVIGDDAIESKKSLFDIVVCDSRQTEVNFAKELEHSDDVEVYAKLPGGFYINTPVGRYNPDWAIAFKEESVTNIYFVVETKGSNDVADLRPVEAAKIECAKRHFESLGHKDLKYNFVASYDKLLELLKQ